MHESHGHVQEVGEAGGHLLPSVNARKRWWRSGAEAALTAHSASSTTLEKQGYSWPIESNQAASIHTPKKPWLLSVNEATGLKAKWSL
eukprot:scaffold155993_cov19-Tisochrysis_lutea.AAC.2